MEACPERADIPYECATIGDLQLQLLISGLLAYIEPIALSVANLRDLFACGDDNAMKVIASQLIEYATGCAGDFQLVTPLRSWVFLRSFLRARSLQRGRRAANLQLPPDTPSS